VNRKADSDCPHRQRGGKTLDNPENFFDIGVAGPPNKIWDSFTIGVAGLIANMEYCFTMQAAGVIIKLRIPFQ
jgi:hypothetical protein